MADAARGEAARRGARSDRAERLAGLASAARRAVDRLATLMGWTAGWAFVAVAVLIGAEVLARNLLRASLQSTTELSGYALALGISWGLAHALSTRQHVRIDVLLNALPLRARGILHVVALSILGLFAAALSYGAVQLARESYDFGATDISLLRIPLVGPQGLWALGLCVFLALIVLMLAEAVLLLLAGDWRRVDALYGSRTYEEEAREALDALGEDGGGALPAKTLVR